MKIRSIFPSIDGEVNAYHQGRLTTFIRTSNCNLRCSYCDTKYAQYEESGKEMSISKIVGKVLEYGLDKITITGGEPLIQADGVKALVKEFAKLKKLVTIETNGSIDTRGYSPSRMVVDYKLPSSGMEQSMILPAFESLSTGDIIKFVVSDRVDFQRALQIQDTFAGLQGVIFAYSPMLTKDGDRGQSARLLKWMLTNPRKNMAFNLQLHKIINLKEPE